MSVPVLFANGPAPFPEYQAPTSVFVAWGVMLSLTFICFGMLAVKKQLSDIKIYLLVLVGFGSLFLTCVIPTLDRLSPIASSAQSTNRLKIIALGTLSFSDNHEKQLPAGASLDAAGKPLHGWQTAILPYIDHTNIHSKIDLTLPWNDARNASVMRQEIEIFQQPILSERQRDGYALSHFAGNVRVIGAQPLKIADIKDGLSNTLLFGQVAHNLRPWGEPMNCRDPAKGVMMSDGFATPRGDYVWFAFADGTVRAISSKVSPEVLKALATPNGGETVTDADIDK